MTINFTDTILGTDGSDWLFAKPGTDTLIKANGGDDGIFGDTGNDSLSGGNGNDTIYSGWGNDTLNGGSGTNIFDFVGLLSGYGNPGSALIENLAGGDRLTLPFDAADILLSTGENATGIAHGEIRFSTPVNGITHLFVGFTAPSNEVACLKIDLVGEFNASQFIAIPGLYGPGWPAELVYVSPVLGTEGDDVLYANFGINTLIGLDGNDSLYGYSEFQSDSPNNSDSLLQGDGGNDYLIGGAGNDELLGGLGNDLLSGGLGVDTLTGGEGMDGFYIPLGDSTEVIDVITDFQGGDDIRLGATFVIQIIASGNPDELVAGDVLIGSPNAGMTRLYIGTDSAPGADLILDLLGSFSAENFTLDDLIPKRIIGDLSPIFSAGSEDWYLRGGRFGDTIYGGNSSQTIKGMAGDDLLDGKSNNDELVGGPGHDTLIGGEGADQFLLEPGIDSSDLIVDLGTSDRIIFSRELATEKIYYEVIDGDGGATEAGQIEVGMPNTGVTRLYFGFDTIPGADAIIDLKGNYQATDFAFLPGWRGSLDYNPAANLPTKQVGTRTTGTNYLSGAGGNDTLIGGLSSTDYLYGKGGNDQLRGGAMNDYLTGGFGNDTLDGGTGTDSIYYHHAVAIDLAARKASGEEGNDVLIGIENAHGSDEADLLSGNSANNFLFGEAGNDLIFGRGGDDHLGSGSGIDTLFGGCGNDVISANNDSCSFGAWGNDTLNGGNTLDGGQGDDTLINGKSMRGSDGNDVYIVSKPGLAVIECKGTTSGSSDLVIMDYYFLGAYTLPANVENGQIETPYAADLTGNTLNNILIAGQGDNVLNGGQGNDTASYITASYYYGGSQGVIVDLLHNGQPQFTNISGNDTLFNIENLIGSHANDQLTGNASSNILNGGYGQDVLQGLDGNDFFVFASIDEVGDTLATADRIVDFKAGDKIDLSGMDANDGTTTNDSFVEMIDALTPFTLAGQLKFAKGALWGNTDSDPGVEFSIVLTGVSALQLSDIIL